MRSILFVATLLIFSLSTALAAPPTKDDLPPGAVARLGTSLTAAVKPGELFPGEINALAYTSDDALILAGNSGWQTWDLLKRVPKQAKPVGGPAFAVARDRGRLFIGSVRKVHAIEPPESATAEPARSWEAASDAVAVLALGPDGNRLVHAEGEHQLAILDIATGKRIASVEVASRPTSTALTANGRLLAVATRDGAVRVYGLSRSGSVETYWGKRVQRADRHTVAFSPDGRLLAYTSTGRVSIVETISGRPLRSLERKFGEGDIRAVAFSLDGRHIGAGTDGPDPVVRVWDVENGAERASFAGHAGRVNAIAFAPNGRTLASAGSDTSVLLWKVPSPSDDAKPMATNDAWEALDSLDPAIAYRAMGTMAADASRSVPLIQSGFRDAGTREKKILRWMRELDHDEYRVRETASRSLIKAGLRASPALTDTSRTKMGPEGEQRVRVILETFEAMELHVPESGLYAEPLRQVRAVRVLELIGGPTSRRVLEEIATGPADARPTREAKAALEAWPTPRSK